MISKNINIYRSDRQNIIFNGNPIIVLQNKENDLTLKELDFPSTYSLYTEDFKSCHIMMEEIEADLVNDKPFVIIINSPERIVGPEGILADESPNRDLYFIELLNEINNILQDENSKAKVDVYVDWDAIEEETAVALAISGGLAYFEFYVKEEKTEARKCLDIKELATNWHHALQVEEQ